MELIINPLGFHCLRDKTYNETTRQVGTSLDPTISIGPAEHVTERPLNRDDFYRVLYYTLPRNYEWSLNWMKLR